MRWREAQVRDGLALAIVLIVASPTGNAAAQVNKALVCRAQLVLACTDRCEIANMAADLELDFARMTASFCRGAQCDDGILSFDDKEGQWDDRPYRVFSARGTESGGFTVSGVIDLETQTFVSVGSHIPMSFGRCASR